MANPFYIKPPDILGELMSGVDSARKARAESDLTSARREAADLYQRGDTQGALARLMRGNDYQGAQVLSGMTNATADRDWRRAEAARSQGNADREHELRVKALERRETPPGFEVNPSGPGMRYIPGGPADPDYLNARKPPKELGFSDIGKLTEEGGKFAAVNRFIGNFKDEYGGATPGLGDIRNWVGRSLPFADDSAIRGAEFWQEYDKYKNVVRNDLFGSALTANEQAAFDRADIKNTMNPEVIRKNLAVQKEILEGAMKRRASSLVVTGYNPEAISQAYGLPLDQIGVTQTGRSRGGAAPAASAGDPLSKARDAIARGADRNAVIQRLIQNGINPSGL